MVKRNSNQGTVTDFRGSLEHSNWLQDVFFKLFQFLRKYLYSDLEKITVYKRSIKLWFKTFVKVHLSYSNFLWQLNLWTSVTGQSNWHTYPTIPEVQRATRTITRFPRQIYLCLCLHDAMALRHEMRAQYNVTFQSLFIDGSVITGA